MHLPRVLTPPLENTGDTDSHPTSMLFIRHGHSDLLLADDPLAFLEDGRSDPALSDAGHHQAELICRRLAQVPISGIYVTPLRRTAQTAMPLYRRLDVALLSEPDLIEVHLGTWEGIYHSKIAQRDPLVALVYSEQRWDVIPGAESTSELTRRVRSAVQRIALAHPDETVAIFCHAAIIARVLALATGSEPFAFVGVDPGSISELLVDRDSWILRRFNDVGHLSEPVLSIPLAE